MGIYKFKFHGVNNKNATFSFLSKNGWMHFKMNAEGEVKRVAYDDRDIVACNTIFQYADSSVEDSKSNKTTFLASKGLLDTLIEREMHLDGIGNVAQHDFLIMTPHHMAIELSNGITVEKTYDAVDEEDAIRIAKINNPLFQEGKVLG